jgi:hypothetical protein
MRKGFYIVGVLLLLLAACTGDREVRAVLDRAEAVMESCPDSAYAELQTLFDGKETSLLPLGETREGLSRSDRAYALLLLAEATNKLYKQMPSDTVFQEVVDYYDRHGNANERMKAYYLMGCIYRDRHEAPMALQWYLDAVEQADTLDADCDYLTLMRIYGQMADVYHSQVMPMEEISAYKQYSWCAAKMDSTYYAIRGIELQLNAYHLISDTVHILTLTDSVHDLYLQAGMPQAAASVYTPAIYLYIVKRDYSKAKQLMDIFEHQSGLFDAEGNIEQSREEYYGVKGLYYQGTNQLDSAKYYYSRMIPYGYELTAYNGLYSVYWQQQNMDSVVKYSLLYRQAFNDNAKTQQQEAMVMVKAMYDYNRQQKIANEKEIELIRRTNLFIYIIIGVVLLAALYSVWYIRNRRAAKEAMRKKEQLYADTLHSAKALLARKEKELEELTQRNLSLEERESILRQEIADAKTRIKVLESSTPMQELLPHNQEEEMLADPVVVKFHQSAYSVEKTQRLTQDDWDELSQLIENRLPRLYASIANNERLTPEKKMIVFLVRLKFKNSEMMNLLGLPKPQMITNRITKLNQLLYGKKTAKDFYNNLREMLPIT